MDEWVYIVMDISSWFIVIGALLLGMGVTGESFRRLPVTSAMIYLAVGVVLGPTILGVFHFNPLKESHLLEIITEIAVLLSLFTAGMKLPTPVSRVRWRTPILLAFASMSLTVGCIALFAHGVFGFSWGAAVLLGAILAPTDPVLATDVQVQHPQDRHRLRFNLTCEAGMNDGSAFPFVMLGLGLLGLHDLGDMGIHWLVRDVIWATLGAILLGILSGAGLAYLMNRYRATRGYLGFWDDFVALGMAALVYGMSLVLNFWGFLAVFAASVSLRYTETALILRSPGYRNQTNAGFTGRILDYHEQLERLSELILVLLVGGTLFTDSWSWRAVGLSLFLFFIVRPLAVSLTLFRSRSPQRLKMLTAWFGVRGIGSLYYLMYAIEHGVPQPVALELIQITLIVITLSILVHGISIKPLFSRHGYCSGKTAMSNARRGRTTAT